MASSVRNTAIKRIQGDVREMMKDPSDQYYAAPLDDNIFDWHFTLRGPRDTEFEGGIYHGRILLPADYPFKPPNIMLLTPNGRFEVKKKICLSISAYHPEEWQPAWGIRLILEALISFMPTKGEGAIGALDYPPEERRRLAKLSCDYKCELCGRVADLLPELKNDDAQEKKPSKYADQIAQLHMHSLEPTDAKPSSGTDDKQSALSNSNGEEDGTSDPQDEAIRRVSQPMSATPPPSSARTAPEEPSQPSEDTAALNQGQTTNTEASAPVTRAPDNIDSILHYLTIALAAVLFALVYKRLLQMQGLLQ
ncbi:hypothetical protein ATCC90586_001551 [Pythium insidiosum]|nr:hypothetical protein ATCC90586_001551 [Pythium insidiosum]